VQDAASGRNRGPCARGWPVTPEQRRLRAKIAANARWSRPMARADQADAARSAILARLEREVDPAGTLSPDERAFLVRAAARKLSAKLNAARARKRQACLSRCRPAFQQAHRTPAPGQIACGGPPGRVTVGHEHVNCRSTGAPDIGTPSGRRPTARSSGVSRGAGASCQLSDVHDVLYCPNGIKQLLSSHSCSFPYQDVLICAQRGHIGRPGGRPGAGADLTCRSLVRYFAVA
jgi:hypothetical protein